MRRKRKTVKQQFYSKVVPNLSTTCWDWVGAKVSKGYGCLRVGGKTISAHRVSHELFIGVIPDGLFVDHLCENKSCVNPEHLEAVTSSENTLRWNANHRKTKCIKGHKFTVSNTYVTKSTGKRFCITCYNDNPNIKGKLKFR